MYKKIKIMIMLVLVVTMIPLECFAYTGNSATVRVSNKQIEPFEKRREQKIKFEITAFTKDGVSDDFTKVMPGGYGFNLKIVNNNNKQYELNQLDYRLLIDGIEYPKGLLPIVESNELEFSSFYGGITGDAKIEVCLKNDKSVKSSYSFSITKDAVNYHVQDILYTFDEEDCVIPEAMKVQNFTYDILNAKYIIKLPGNPVEEYIQKRFNGWVINEVIYRPNDIVMVDRDTQRLVISPDVQDISGDWIKSSNGKWFYKFENGKYPVNMKLSIGNNNYLFDKEGWMRTGWAYRDNHWEYYNPKDYGVEGSQVINQWKNIQGNWYYFYKNGNMAYDTDIDGYHVSKSGEWVYNHWIKSSNGKWWYFTVDGGYYKNNIFNIDGNQYCFDEAGWMVVGWKYQNGHWRYFNTINEGVVGAMAKGWKKIAGKWYYFHKDGTMATDETIDGYYVNSDGIWA